MWAKCGQEENVRDRGPDKLFPSSPQLLAAAVASSIVSGMDTGYAGSNGLEAQQFGSNNSPCGYICYGFGEFDGQGSGHDFAGNVRFPSIPEPRHMSPQRAAAPSWTHVLQYVEQGTVGQGCVLCDSVGLDGAAYAPGEG